MAENVQKIYKAVVIHNDSKIDDKVYQDHELIINGTNKLKLKDDDVFTLLDETINENSNLPITSNAFQIELDKKVDQKQTENIALTENVLNLKNYYMRIVELDPEKTLLESNTLYIDSNKNFYVSAGNSDEQITGWDDDLGTLLSKNSLEEYYTKEDSDKIFMPKEYEFDEDVFSYDNSQAIGCGNIQINNLDTDPLLSSLSLRIHFPKLDSAENLYIARSKNLIDFAQECIDRSKFDNAILYDNTQPQRRFSIDKENNVVCSSRGRVMYTHFPLRGFKGRTLYASVICNYQGENAIQKQLDEYADKSTLDLGWYPEKNTYFPEFPKDDKTTMKDFYTGGSSKNAKDRSYLAVFNMGDNLKRTL